MLINIFKQFVVYVKTCIIFVPSNERKMIQHENGDTVIYSMTDPRTKKVRYIGKTSVLNDRSKNHLLYKSKNKEMGKWIKSLLRSGAKPIINVLEKVDDFDDANKIEKKWIEKYIKDGAPLVNLCHVKSKRKKEPNLTFTLALPEHKGIILREYLKKKKIKASHFIRFTIKYCLENKIRFKKRQRCYLLNIK